jgi:hypothetical protein
MYYVFSSLLVLIYNVLCVQLFISTDLQCIICSDLYKYWFTMHYVFRSLKVLSYNVLCVQLFISTYLQCIMCSALY